MKTKYQLGGFALATMAAASFLTVPIVTADDPSGAVVGRCTGVNACKGHSSCRTAHNACKGQNTCKAHGFVTLTKSQCDQIGGRFEPQLSK